MHRATAQKNEFYQKIEDDEKKEFKQMKDQALAPLMALLQEKMYAGMAGKSEGLRRIGAVIAAIDNDQPLPKFDDMSPQSQTGSHPVKPSQTKSSFYNRCSSRRIASAVNCEQGKTQ
jgi:hypothetical protein